MTGRNAICQLDSPSLYSVQMNKKQQRTRRLAWRRRLSLIAGAALRLNELPPNSSHSIMKAAEVTPSCDFDSNRHEQKKIPYSLF